jgi:hypothetical protein
MEREHKMKEKAKLFMQCFLPIAGFIEMIRNPNSQDPNIRLGT